MPDERSRDLHSCLSNLTVDVSAAALTHVSADWQDFDVVPPYNKLYLILDGEGMLRIDGRDYYPKAGEAYLMAAGRIQSYSATSEHTFTKYWCHFTASVGERGLFDIVRVPDFFKVEELGAATDMFKALIAAYHGNDLVSALSLKSAMLSLIAWYLEGCGAGRVELFAAESNARLRRVLGYIEENISSPLSVDALASVAHLQKNYFIRMFRDDLGLPPMKYVTARRIEIGKNLLARSEASVSEIASLTGFGDVFHFSRSFKERTGFTPTAFRAMAAKSAVP